MYFSKPFIRFRRTRRESFQDGYLQHARQQVSFELGVSGDVRTEVAELKNKLDRLTAELLKQKAIVGMLRNQVSEPAARLNSPPCHTPIMPVRPEGVSQNGSGNDGRSNKSPAHQRAAAETNVVIRLIPDEAWS